MRMIIWIFLLLSASYASAETWTFQGVALVPSQPWEYTPASPQGTVFEPKVLQRTSCLIVAAPCLGMWYSGGWEKCSAGYAETSDLSGKSGWVKYPANPIIGQGRLGLAIGCRKFVMQYGGLYYVYFVKSLSAGAGLYVTSSLDGVTNLAPPQLVLSSGPYDTLLDNSFVWFENGVFTMLYDSLTSSSSAPWQMFLATSPSPTGPFIKLNNAYYLSSFSINGGEYGGMSALRAGATLHVWTLNGAPNTYVPTDIYHFCDLAGVRVANGGAPIITHRAPAFDQAGDPWSIDLQGTGTIFADEDNNTTPYAQISLWTMIGPLASSPCP